MVQRPLCGAARIAPDVAPGASRPWDCHAQVTPPSPVLLPALLRGTRVSESNVAPWRVRRSCPARRASSFPSQAPRPVRPGLVTSETLVPLRGGAEELVSRKPEMEFLGLRQCLRRSQLEVQFTLFKSTGKLACYSSAFSRFSLLPSPRCRVWVEVTVVCVVLEEIA